MNEKDWRDLSAVFRAGADEYRRVAIAGDGAKFHDATAFEAMADRCVWIADSRQPEVEGPTGEHHDRV